MRYQRKRLTLSTVIAVCTSSLVPGTCLEEGFAVRLEVQRVAVGQGPVHVEQNTLDDRRRGGIIFSCGVLLRGSSTAVHDAKDVW